MLVVQERSDRGLIRGSGYQKGLNKNLYPKRKSLSLNAPWDCVSCIVSSRWAQFPSSPSISAVHL